MKTVHVAAAIIEKDHQILIAKRLKGTHKDLWEFPGGKIEENESSKQALIREIKEEMDRLNIMFRKNRISEEEYDTDYFKLEKKLDYFKS